MGAGNEALRAIVVAAGRLRIGRILPATAFIVQCYQEIGYILPDDLLKLHRSGERIMGSDLLPADLIFRTGRGDLFHPGDLKYGVGHVGIYAGARAVLHAAYKGGLVREDAIDAFIDDDHGRFRGVCRLIACA